MLFRALVLTALAAVASSREVGTSVQADAHEPHAWRPLNAQEQALFDRGYAVFNTEWVPADTPAGRIDGLGPLFNSQGCDACHNSRRRGRGPQGDGDAPSDLVIQLGRLDGAKLTRGTREYGFVLSTAAIAGFVPEGRVHIRYEPRAVALGDGTLVQLHQPVYTVDQLSGPPLPSEAVLMPRMPPPVQGVGLLERIPEAELERVARWQLESTRDIRGTLSILRSADGGRSGAVGRSDTAGGPGTVGRFGWQATEPTVASQVAVAFAREMGLTNLLVAQSDCGSWNTVCLNAAAGGSPEVERGLFEAVVAFEDWHAVAVEREPDRSASGAHLFQSTGCADCHRVSVRAQPGTLSPYTDLLLHDMGKGLADRNLKGIPVPERWRTAPLWGMHAAFVTGRPVRLLHDGRAASLEEAILWHDGEGRRARDSYARLFQEQRRALVEWVETL